MRAITSLEQQLSGVRHLLVSGLLKIDPATQLYTSMPMCLILEWNAMK